VVCAGKPVRFAFIADMAEESERIPREGRFPVSFMCEMLGVARGGYYAWLKREPSQRQLDDGELGDLIACIHKENKGRYGIDRVRRELARRGVAAGPQRVLGQPGPAAGLPWPSQVAPDAQPPAHSAHVPACPAPISSYSFNTSLSRCDSRAALPAAMATASSARSLSPHARAMRTSCRDHDFPGSGDGPRTLPPTLPELTRDQQVIDLHQQALHDGDGCQTGIWRQPPDVGNRQDCLPPGESVRQTRRAARPWKTPMTYEDPTARRPARHNSVARGEPRSVPPPSRFRGSDVARTRCAQTRRFSSCDFGPLRADQFG
jgi:hypothetical protein